MLYLWLVHFSIVSSAYCQQPFDNHNNAKSKQQSDDRILSPNIDSTYRVDTYRGSRTFNFEEYEDNGSYGDSVGSLVDTIPGKAGKDFPAYTSIPKTSFTCKGRNTGYFADPETDCQVFHICIANGQKISFLCPNGSIFNQKVSVCDWWYDVDCISSTELIDSNDIQRKPAIQMINYHNDPNDEYQYQHFIVETDPYYDLSLASSGGNRNPKYEKDVLTISKKNGQNVEKTTRQEGKRRNVLRDRNSLNSTSSTTLYKVKD